MWVWEVVDEVEPIVLSFKPWELLLRYAITAMHARRHGLGLRDP